jgi:hypothetical protein
VTDSSDFVPAIAIIVIFGAPIAAFIISRVLAHQERMEMLRRGIVPPPNPRDMRRAMKYGWTPGAAQEPANSYAYYQNYQADFAAQQQLRRGMQVAFIGLALLIGLGFIGYHGDGTFYPGPWLLGGLIPLFVGLAQIIGAVLSGASFGPLSARQRVGPLPGAGPEAAPRGATGGMPPPPGPTYGGWRPGTTPEIEKPASPPDYRT